MSRPKPQFNGDPSDPVDLEFHERELRAWEEEVELEKASRVELAAEPGEAFSILAAQPKDEFEEFLRGLSLQGVPGPPGAAGANGASVDLDDVLITDDGHVVADEEGNLVRSGGVRV